ncbi:hypothetical protein KHQ06_18350 [Nocardia tengchongensis]|uniref:Uncharacterized protein n=1 Tax=Nocardia tengchongensis TaxID=2055889 RepID=A0ABX8CXW6_9NOCA|nr:hypothetical protein [Nocardia tengchongensis]QVI24507.1 hypothetical protein KHQ06_18350 [Nocardia tengchongensis]
MEADRGIERKCIVRVLMTAAAAAAVFSAGIGPATAAQLPPTDAAVAPVTQTVSTGSAGIDLPICAVLLSFCGLNPRPIG